MLLVLSCLLLSVPGVFAAGAARRAIEPPNGSVSLSGAPAVELGQETRPVLSRAPRRVLRLNQSMKMPEGRLEIPVELPADLGVSGPVWVEGYVSLRDPETVGSRDVHALRAGERLHLSAPPTLVEGRGATLSIDVPEETVGHRGLLTVIARELPVQTKVVSEAGPWPVASGDRLEFGYGVEPVGWEAPFPPARFRVLGRVEGRDDVVLFDRRIDPAHEPRDRIWFDSSVGLDALVGARATFVFEAEALPEREDAEIARTFPVFSNPRLRARLSDEKRRNLVLISLDTLRARSVSSYGYRHETTPQLDRRLAAAGARVQEAVAPAPFTPPSHMTMLTGLEPCVHGVRDQSHILAPEHVLLAEMLRADGYQTAAFTENAYVVAGAGFARGFETYVERRDAASASPGFAVETFGAAERWLAEDAHEPFFLFLHTYQVHHPYTPPRAFRELFGDYPPNDLREQRWRDDEKAYDQEIRYTDDLLGGFLDALESRGFGDDTLIVVTSDHGEEFGERQWGKHGFALYDDALLVPLVFRAPGLIPPGTVVRHQVGLADLVPTVLELLGVPLPRPVQGRSFASLLRGEGGDFEERPIVSRSSAGTTHSVRTRKVKYIRREGKSKGEEVYFLEEDPSELRNQRGAHVAKATARKALEEHAARCDSYRRAYPITAGRDSLFEQRADWLINRDEIESKLRSLGYVE